MEQTISLIRDDMMMMMMMINTETTRTATSQAVIKKNSVKCIMTEKLCQVRI